MAWTDDHLDAMRAEGDPIADAVVADLYAQGSIASVNALLQELVDNDEPIPSSAPASVRAYFDQTAALPAWMDAAAVHRGQMLFGRYGPQIVLALHCASLPECYAAWKGVKVLASTRRLSDDPDRRIMETAQFVIDAMAPDGFSPDGSAIRTSQKVRLLHAAVRHLLRTTGRWDEAAWGVPINQEDLAGTLMSFSWVIAAALEKLGIDLTPTEKEDYLHAWKVIGTLLGMREEVLPRNMSDAGALVEAIRRRHYGPSDEGRELTAALLRHLEYRLPGDVFDPILAALMRHLIGDDTANLLGVPASRWSAASLKPLLWLCGLQDEVGDLVTPWAKLSALIGHYALQGFLLVQRKGQRAPFHIPESLASQWGLVAPPCPR